MTADIRVPLHVRLLLGSSNRHKVREWRAMLEHLAIDLVDPVQLGLDVDAVEDGANAEENARIKAQAYFDAAGIPAFSLDAALRIDGLPPEEQPDVRVRRICRGGEHTTDAEMVSHYRDLLRRLGGRATGEWTFGIALAPAPGRILSARRVHRTQFVATPSPVLAPGAALQSLQVNPATGRYFSEMTPSEHADRLRERARWIVGFVIRDLL